YYLYFPAQDKSGIFRIGVATSTSPSGPFLPLAQPIADSLSIDPALFTDDDGRAYLYVCGLSGGQLQNWQSGTYDSKGAMPTGAATALGPKVAELKSDMTNLAGSFTEVAIVDSSGKRLQANDNDWRFFEGVWV